MIVDDYQFRHFSSIRVKMFKKLHFVKEDQEQRVFLLNISQFQENGKIDLTKILHYLKKKGLTIEDYHFYVPLLQLMIDPSYSSKVQLDLLEEEDLKFYLKYIKYPLKKQHPQTDQETPNQLENIQNTPKNYQEPICRSKLKQPQRKIGEVIYKVKRWRQMFETNQLSLAQGAKLINIPKKSLDDYYLVLRVGQYCQYDFASNMNSGMGDLRNFIKKQNIKLKGRLPIQIYYFKLFSLAQQWDKQSDTLSTNIQNMDMFQQSY